MDNINEDYRKTICQQILNKIDLELSSISSISPIESDYTTSQIIKNLAESFERLYDTTR